MARKKAAPSAPAARKRATPVKSMTGYGRAVFEKGKSRFTAEIRSVNGRFLKLTVKLPTRYGALEDRVKALLSTLGVIRGSVEAGVYFDTAQGESAYALDGDALGRYAQQARAIAKKNKLDGELSVGALLSLPGAVLREDKVEDLDAIWAQCEKALTAALKPFEDMRIREGEAMVADVRLRLKQLRQHREELIALAPQAREAAIERYRDRVQKALENAGLDDEVDRSGLEREIVLLSDKMDVSEELARLESHLEQMDETLRDGGEVGKKLDFLTQELFREVNTTGSKSQDKRLTHLVVEMKGVVEKIREQVQNLE